MHSHPSRLYLPKSSLRYSPFCVYPSHLVLPALTSLCVISRSRHVDGDDVQEILPFIARHAAHGPQDIQSLHSLLFRNDKSTEILAWTLPDMDVELANQFSFYDDMHSARVAFTVTDKDWSPGTDAKVFDAVMAALPLGRVVTLTAQNHSRSLDKLFWLCHIPRWPLLRRVRLWPSAARGFREMLLQDKGGQESPLLPSLKSLILIDVALFARRTGYLCNAFMKRMKQGVPLETLDLRRCLTASCAAELLRNTVVEVLSPEETLETAEQMLSAPKARDLYLEDSGAEDQTEDESRYIGSGDGVGIQ